MASILVVDDDVNNRLLLATVLQHAGHTVLEAQSGRAGVEIAVCEKPDLIVVDLSLPDISGAELIRLLRSDERTRSALIALYTATRLSPAIEELTELYGIDGIIPKPADPHQLLEAFAGLLARRRQ
jgi:CheY-like chemotaxis protein